MLSRRTLLQAIGGTAAIAAGRHPLFAEGVARRVSVAAPRVGAQVYVWSQLYSRRGIDYRDELAAIVKTHAEAGYRSLELMAGAVEPRYAPALRRAGEEHGVRYPVVYSGALLYDDTLRGRTLAQMRELAANARALGAEAINCNPDPKPAKARKSDRELAAEAEGINALGKLLREEGLSLTLHQHDAEMQEGARNWRFWLSHTEPESAQFCFDAHWALRGGQQPIQLLKECLPRLASLHLRNSREGVWWEDLDDGDLDYRPLAHVLRQAQYKGFLTVELAMEAKLRVTRPLAESLRRSRAYVERRFL